MQRGMNHNVTNGNKKLVHSINFGSVSRGSFFLKFISNLEFPFINLEFAFQIECFLIYIKLVNDGWKIREINPLAKDVCGQEDLCKVSTHFTALISSNHSN